MTYFFQFSGHTIEKLHILFNVPLTYLSLWSTNGTSEQRSQLGPAGELRNESEPNWAIGWETRRRLGLWRRGNWNVDRATVLWHSVSSESKSKSGAFLTISCEKSSHLWPTKTENWTLGSRFIFTASQWERAREREREGEKESEQSSI